MCNADVGTPRRVIGCLVFAFVCFVSRLACLSCIDDVATFVTRRAVGKKKKVGCLPTSWRIVGSVTRS